jgi:vacuolar-type H+-ATPase subunit I/STV1
MDFILFALPLIPLAVASWQDFKTGLFDEKLIWMTVLAALWWKALIYPQMLLPSLAFGCFALFVGFFLEFLGAWHEGDALMYGAVGFALPSIDIWALLLTSMVVFLLVGIFEEAILKKWRKKRSALRQLPNVEAPDVTASWALYAIMLMYIVYWVVTL